MALRTWSIVALLGWACLLPGAAPAASAGEDAPAGRPIVIPLIPLPGGGVGVNAEVAGHTALFLFDTGEGNTAVTPATATLSGCRQWGRVTGFRATGERMDAPRCDALRLTLGGEPFTLSTASVFDLQALVSPRMPALAGSIALDLFAGRVLTIRPLAHQLVLETRASFRQRIDGAIEVPVRAVRDAEGVALTLDAAVGTADGRAWMELDTGNMGPLMVGEHVAAPLGLDASRTDRQPAGFALVGGIPVRGPARVGNLIMDGDVGESVLGRWDVTLDLANDRAWFRPARP